MGNIVNELQSHTKQYGLLLNPSEEGVDQRQLQFIVP
jgi:hypothetical protein